MLVLNKEQLKACHAPMGHNLVIASAGTGKTSTIIGRIAYLLESGVGAHEILLLTFTNKAAQEMISRLLGMFDEKCIKDIEAGTFHAVGYRYLKSHSTISLKQPRELKLLLKNLYASLTFRSCGVAPYKAEYLFDLYSLYQNQRNSDGGFAEWISRRCHGQEFHAHVYEQLFCEYEETKKSYGYVGFNDLLLLYKDFMQQSHPPYKEVLVDEYQDTNPLQDSVLCAINPKSLFCVGDYDQSIYAFNGADISIIANFENRFKDARVFSLTKNYRSNASILEIANRVIANNVRIYPKKLEVTKKSADASVKLFVYDDIFEQYMSIAHKIAQSHIPYHEVAVIFRNNAAADGIETALREHNIPSKRKSGISFFESKEIAVVLDLLTLLYNPSDMMAFVNVMSHAKGVGSAMGREVYEELYEYGHGNILNGLIAPKHKPNTLALDFVHTHKDFASHPIYNSLHKDTALFLEYFYHFVRQLNMNYYDTYGLIEYCINSPFLAYIFKSLATKRAMRRDSRIDSIRYNDVLSRINAKVRLLLNLSKNYKELGRFLNAMILGGNELNEGSGVNLLSIHSAKGLEYHDVYVVDLMEGRFPNHKLMSKNGGAIDEERRLFYVAVTRAKENLALSFARRNRLQNIDYKPSIFLKEAGFKV